MKNRKGQVGLSVVHQVQMSKCPWSAREKGVVHSTTGSKVQEQGKILRSDQ